MDLWQRQPGETAKAFSAFVIYRELGPKERSHAKVVQIYGAGKRVDWLIQRWSKKYNWVERVQAYDDHLDKVRIAEHEQAVREMKKRHLTLAKALQSKAAERLRDLTPKDFKKIPDLVKTLVEGTKLERLTLGEATEKVEGEVAENITIRMWQPKKEKENAATSK